MGMFSAQNEWVGARWKEGQKVLRAAENANDQRLKKNEDTTT